MSRLVWLALGAGLGTLAVQRLFSDGMRDSLGNRRDQLADRLDERIDRTLQRMDEAGHRTVDRIRAHSTDEMGPTMIITEAVVSEI